MRRGRGGQGTIWARGREASIFHHYISVLRRLEIARSDRYRGPAISPSLLYVGQTTRDNLVPRLVS